MAITIKTKQGKAETAVEHKHKSAVVTQQNGQEVVGEEGVLEGPLCEVGVEASLTLNMGNFNSTRLQVSLKCPSTPGEIDDVYEFAKGWVNTRMEQLAAEVEVPDNAG